jgi:hypothetical protein
VLSWEIKLFPDSTRPQRRLFLVMGDLVGEDEMNYVVTGKFAVALWPVGLTKSLGHPNGHVTCDQKKGRALICLGR